MWCYDIILQVAMYLIIIFFSFTFASKNNNIVQLSILLNNEANVLESFFHMFDMVGR